MAHDPESAEAIIILSLINHHIAIVGFVPDVRRAMETAYVLVRCATLLGDRTEYAHWASGNSSCGLLKYDESLALERAIVMNPNCSLAYGRLATLLGILGRSDETNANQEIAVRSDPLD